MALICRSSSLGIFSRMKNLRVESRRTMRSFDKDESQASVSIEERRLPKSEVLRFIDDCLSSLSVSKSKSCLVADNLVMADVRGHFSHGLNRLPLYVDDIKEKVCTPNNEAIVIKESPATAWMDGQSGLGVVVGKMAMDVACNKAENVGIGLVVLKGSNHFGVCQWYIQHALQRGLMGLCMTNASPLLTPTRSKQRMFGTNPIAIGARGSKADDSFLLDMATSTAALGKVEIQMRKNEPLPSDCWALGNDGSPTRNAHEAFYEGRGLMPLGGGEINSGFKGYGLAMMVELMCGVLGGAAFGPHIRPWQSHSKVANLGQMFMAIDPKCFSPSNYKECQSVKSSQNIYMSEDLQSLMDTLRGLEPVDPDLPVLVAGDKERNHERQVDMNGYIEYTESHIHMCRSIANELNVQPPKAVSH